MGHLVGKYNAAYFLGGVDAATGQEYGVRGRNHFASGQLHPRHAREFNFTAQLAGPLAGKAVLEIGCGRGDMIQPFLDAEVASYTGCDFSADAIRIAQGRFQDRRVKIQRAEATDLDSVEAYDVVSLYDAIEHIPVFEMEQVWPRIHQALRPGGIVVISTPIFDNPNVADHTEQKAAVSGMHCHKQTWGTLMRACLAHGFTVAATDHKLLAAVRTQDLPLLEPGTHGQYQQAQDKLLVKLGVRRLTLDRAAARALVGGAGRLAICCALDDQPYSAAGVLRLLLSLRWFGGVVAGANFFVCGTHQLDPATTREFERLGAFVRVVPQFRAGDRASNMLAALNLPELQAYDTVVLLSPEVICVGDMWPYLDGQAFQGRMACGPSIAPCEFQRIFQHFGLPLPPPKYRYNPGGQRTGWHCNTGVLVLPRAIRDQLVPAWAHYHQALWASNLLTQPALCAEASLALAFVAAPVPFKELPLGMNFQILPNYRYGWGRAPVLIQSPGNLDPRTEVPMPRHWGARRQVAKFNKQMGLHLATASSHGPPCSPEQELSAVPGPSNRTQREGPRPASACDARLVGPLAGSEGAGSVASGPVGSTSSRGPGRVILGCVAENQPKYLAEALFLVQSLRWFGGQLADAHFLICVVDDLDPDYARMFQALGAIPRVVPRMSAKHGHSNKLRFLELPELRDYDTAILLDCDTVVVSDPAPWLDGTTLQARMAGEATIPHAVFEQVFRHFGLPMPKQEYRCNPGNQPTIWYVNGGVLVFPREVLARFGPSWRAWNDRLLARLDLLGTHTTFCDQASMALAMAATPVPFRELPLGMNYPLKKLPAATGKQEEVVPVILHHHHRLDHNGCLQSSPCRPVQECINRLNERLRTEGRKCFEDRLWWDFRYTHAPAQGSGLGSREAAARYKQEMLRLQVETYRPAGILDIGCGDRYVTKDLPADLYTGVDISPVVIEQNRRAFPGQQFHCGNPLELALTPTDMVLCLDLVIHIEHPDHYRALVARLVHLTTKVGVVSGFEQAPPAGTGRTFFHEPLSTTLRRAGARNLHPVGAYRNVTAWRFEPADTTAVGPAPVVEPGLEKPLFLVGCMRSGTTLLASLLGAFPGIIHCPFELKHIWSQVGKVPMASPRTRETRCPQLTAGDLKVGQREALTQAFMAEMDKQRSGKSAAAVFLTKNPHLCNKLPLVDALFPDARYLWIHRPLPQVVASLKKLFETVHRNRQTWHYWPPPGPGQTARCWEAFHFEAPPATMDAARIFPGGDVRYLAEYWFESNRAVAEFLAAINPARSLVIREDELIAQPEAELARCLGYLGQPLPNGALLNQHLDQGRNGLYGKRLTPLEQLELLAFIHAMETTWDQVFPNTRHATVRLLLDGLVQQFGKEAPVRRSLKDWFRKLVRRDGRKRPTG